MAAAIATTAIMPTSSRPDYVEFSRARYLPDVELVSVAYRERSFPEHSHDEFVIGTIISGAETLTVNRTPWLASAGSVLRLAPGEVHANASEGEAQLCYKVLYIPAPTLLGYLGTPEQAVYNFKNPVVRNDALNKLVRRAHSVLASSNAGKLAQESAIVELARHLGTSRLSTTTSIAHAAADQVRRYIDDQLGEHFGLAELSQLTGLSPFHLVRTFKRAFGLSPLAYRNQRRIVGARRRLSKGQSTAQVALELGFADQSHLTRNFQRLVGISPQGYARAVRPVGFEPGFRSRK